MFHQIIFVLLIVSSLFRNFNRRVPLFSVVHEHRLQENSIGTHIAVRIKRF